MKLLIEDKKEEQIMILMVAQQYQIIHDIDHDYGKLNYTERLAKSLFGIQFDAYDIAIKIDNDSVFEFIDESTTYDRMLEEGAVKIFRDLSKFEVNYE